MRQTASASKGRLIALLLGLCCAAVLLELGVRVAGFSFLSGQHRRNEAGLAAAGRYRILCVGDSMTAGTYPRLLEDILNERVGGPRFAVFDEGRPATISNQTLAALPEQLARYRPHMVVAMMGINDPGRRLLYGRLPAESRSPFKSLRLARFLGFLSKEGRPPEPTQPSEPEPPPRRARTPLPCKPPAESVARLLVDANALLPRGEASLALPLFQRVLRLSPDEPSGLLGLGECHALLGRPLQAESLFRRATRADLSGDRQRAWLRLGTFYRKQSRLEEALAAYRKSARLDPGNSAPFREMAIAVWSRGDLNAAAGYFQEAAARDPEDEEAFLKLGTLFLRMGRQERARQAFRRAAALNPQNDKAHAGLATACELAGDVSQAREHRLRAEELRRAGCVAMTRENYRLLRRLVEAGGARLVCVQYPRRSLQPLRNIFPENADVLFVDNEAPFDEALAKAPLADYFIDFFAGDFGHCTAKGYRLLAENIAAVILRETRGKEPRS